MRLRNVKNADEVINKRQDIVVLEPFLKKGKWPKDKPLHLEIGMGKGQFLITMAKNNPDYFFLGLEKEKSVLKKALDKLLKKQDNLLFILGDAKNIEEMFASNEVDHIYLNFSDPWPKKRHLKRRLTDPQSLNFYRDILKKEGIIEFKTDNRALFTFSLRMFVEASWKILDLSLNLHEDKQDIITTEYEDKFVSENKIIYYVKVQNGKNEII